MELSIIGILYCRDHVMAVYLENYYDQPQIQLLEWSITVLCSFRYYNDQSLLVVQFRILV